MDEMGGDYDVDYSNIIHKPRNSLTLSSDNTTDEDILLTPPNGSSSSVEFCLTPEPRRVERNLFNHQRIRLHHSTPLFTNRFSNCSQNPKTWHVAGPSNPYPRRVKSVIDVELPVEYVNPFTPDGKMIVNKVKAQQRLYSLTLNPVGRKIDLNDDDAEANQSSLKSDPSSSKEDSLVNDMTSIKDESFVNCDFELPMRSRLSEFNVSRFNEEFIQLNELGKGHHGCVFKCLNKMNGCVYAVKRTIKPVRSSLQERIIRNEIYAHGALDHPNIVRNFSSWKEEEFVYIQNEFCNGGSLDAYIEKKTMSEALVRTLLMHIASALRYIHEKGLAHMDVKPANILLCIDNSKARRNNDIDGFSDEETDSIVFKLADFGHISKLDEKYDVEEGDCRYMPREILQDNLTCIDRADIFSLGLTAYEVAGGGPLPKNGEKWQDIRNGKLRNLSQHSENFNELIASLTRPEPEKRPSAAELVQMLNYNPSDEDLMGYFNQARNKKALLDHNVKTVEKYMTYVNSRVRKQIQEKSAALAAKKRGAVTKTKFVNRRIKRSSSTTLF